MIIETKVAEAENFKIRKVKCFNIALHKLKHRVSSVKCSIQYITNGNDMAVIMGLPATLWHHGRRGGCNSVRSIA